MRVFVTDAAKADLTEIGDYIARDNPRSALSFVRELRAAALRLGDLPRAFPLVPRYERRGVRRCLFGNYLIFYRVDSDRVVVIHILHGARDYESLLFGDSSNA